MEKLKIQRKRMYYPLKINASNRTLVKPRNIRLFKNNQLIPTLHAILIRIAEEANLCIRSNAPTSKSSFLKLLDKVLPNDYFGCTRNRKIFYVAVKKILTSSISECVYVKSLIHSCDYETVPWLSQVTDGILRRKFALIANLWLLNSVVKPLIRFFYKCLYVNTNEMILVERTRWQKFESKAFKHLLRTNCLTFDKTQHHSNTTHKHLLGLLRIFPKNDFNGYRPIVVTRRDQNTKHKLRRLSRIIANESRGFRLKKSSLYEYWKTFTEQTTGQKCYGIKVDVVDAYGNINMDVLCRIIDEIKNPQLTNSDKLFIKNQMKQKYVIFRTHKRKPLIWRWNHGIPQGSVLSGSLCELYMRYLDYKNLQEFYKDTTFLYRCVDDYIFCTTDEKLIARFLNKITLLHRQNGSKVQTMTDEIHFYGKIFNVETGTVRGLYEYKKNTALRHRFKFWNTKKPIKWTEPDKFLSEAMLFHKNTFHFDALELNTVFNTEMVVLENFFNALVYTAYKFDAAVMAIYDMQKNPMFMYTELKKAVVAHGVRAEKKIHKFKGRNFCGNIDRSTLIYVSFKAFELVLRRRNEVYKEALQMLHGEINCRVTKYAWKNIGYFNKLPQVFQHLRMKRAL